MNKYTFVMLCDHYILKGEIDDPHIAQVEAVDRIEAARSAKAELTKAMKRDGKDAGEIQILVVFEGHPTIDGFGCQTGRYER